MTMKRPLRSALLLTALLTGCEEDPFAIHDGPMDAGMSVDAATQDVVLMDVMPVVPKPDAVVMPTTKCGDVPGLQPGDYTMTLSHGGMDRRFLLHVPPSYDGKSSVPLVLDMHGYFSSAEQQKLISGWAAKSDREGFLLVHPDGFSRSWNGGTLCCGEAMRNGVDDEGFLRAIVQKLKAEACINPKRVYATGLSNGGAMAHLLACRAADVFAATAPVSMSNGAVPCEPGRGISVTLFRATGDSLVPYEHTDHPIPGAEADFESWKTRNGCSGEPTTNGVCKTYSQCRDGAEVTLCTITTTAADEPWAGHVLYPQALREDAGVPGLVWSMFERHELK